jgi:hypothetical protein
VIVLSERLEEFQPTGKFPLGNPCRPIERIAIYSVARSIRRGSHQVRDERACWTGSFHKYVFSFLHYAEQQRILARRPSGTLPNSSPKLSALTKEIYFSTVEYFARYTDKQSPTMPPMS